MNYSDFILLLDGYRPTSPTKTGIVECGRAFCPSHQKSLLIRNSNRSLSCGHTTDDAIVFNCFYGCSLEEICASIGVQVIELFSNTEKTHSCVKGVGSNWHSAMSSADAICEATENLIFAKSADELHLQIHRISQLGMQFKAACRMAAKSNRGSV